LSQWDFANTLRIQRKLKDKEGNNNRDPFTGWHELLNNYSYRKITFETDRPLAISGLAKEVSDVTNG
jgi:hypothetical protein